MDVNDSEDHGASEALCYLSAKTVTDPSTPHPRSHLSFSVCFLSAVPSSVCHLLLEHPV